MLRAGVIALLALAGAAPAAAGNVAMSVGDVPLHGARSLASAAPAQRFNMLGLHWQGAGSVEYRTRRIHGRWSGWRLADADAGPDRSSPERAATRGWHDGGLDWVGGSDRVRFRTRGRVARLRAYYLWSRVDTAPPRRVQVADSPAIITRAAWKADEKIRREKPVYAPVLRFALVHHTAGSNNYSPAQSAAIVRGVEVYHVKGNGWNDIGYNFLVDKYGQVFEGRYGGMERNVVGAHALGFNSGSVGVSLLGNYNSASITSAQRAALVKLLAWRLDLAHVDPASTVAVTSSGNPKYKAGKQVILRAISAHRDTYPTECPGNAAYAQLSSIVAEVARTGLPKLYQPTVVGALGGPVRFQARLSSALAWAVSVTNAAGTIVAQGSGRSAAVDWTWSSTRTGGPFRWTIEAPGLRPATGSLGGSVPTVPPPATLLSAVQAPPVLTPAADGTFPALHLAFALGQPATVTADLFDANGLPLVRILGERRTAGANSFDWYAAQELRDGRYRLVVAAQAGTKTAGTGTASTVLDLVVDRTVAGPTLLQPQISPNGDGVSDRLTVTFALAAPTPVKLEIVDTFGRVVATVVQATLVPGPQVFEWDGSANGISVPDGAFTARLTVTDGLGDVAIPLPFRIDLTPPVLRILDAKTLKLSLTEPASVTLMVNGRKQVRPEPAGVFTVPHTVVVKSVSAQAVDAAGNTGPLVSASVR